MGTHKLLLEIEGETVIARLVRQLQDGGIDQIHVLVREDDAKLREELYETQAAVHLAFGDTVDMKASVTLLLSILTDQSLLRERDGWLLIPADHPIVEPRLLSLLIEAWQHNPEQIVVPSVAGKRGHPTIFPASLVGQLPSIPDDQGLNWLLHRDENAVLELACDEHSIHWDLDTPEDWEQFEERFRSR